tara:strand:- start:7 stop:366 length:360 start_codon:yes stop_codon:yes gene_type:complete
MDKKDYIKFYSHYLSEYYNIPEERSIYTPEILDVIDKYTKWLKANGLKAKPDGFPTTFKKKKTKPTGRNPDIVKRNKKIGSEYFALTQNGDMKAKAAKEKLAKKYGLKPLSIESILKKG